MPTSVREILNSSQTGSSYFLRVDWVGQSLALGFQVLLTDGRDAWRGEVSAAALSSEATDMELPPQKYVQDVQQALTAAGDRDLFSFTLTLDPVDRRSLTLTYEKMQKGISTSALKLMAADEQQVALKQVCVQNPEFRLGCIQLDVVDEPAEAIRGLLVHGVQRGNCLLQQNHQLEDQNLKLRREHLRISKELQRFASHKEVLEAELFSRFVLVLNEKKLKIRSLQKTLTNLQEPRSSGRPDPVEPVQTVAENDYGGSTDEDVQAVAPSQPSTESSEASPLDASLHDITDVAPSRKRRLHQLAVKDVTVKKPDLDIPERHRKSPPVSRKIPQRSEDASFMTTAEDLFDF